MGERERHSSLIETVRPKRRSSERERKREATGSSDLPKKQQGKEGHNGGDRRVVRRAKFLLGF